MDWTREVSEESAASGAILSAPIERSGTTRAETYVEYFKVFWGVADDRCRRYYGSDKPSGHAAGLESLSYFAGLVIELMPDSWQTATIIDAGAGASSAILRTYFGDVISCDPDPEYLAQVERACAKMGLPAGKWAAGVPTERGDATFYDYGTHQRIPTFPAFLDLTRRLIWVDDAHDQEVLDGCEAVCNKRGLELRRARGAYDNLRRFGAYALTADGPPPRPPSDEVEELRHEVKRLHADWQRVFELDRKRQELLTLYEASLSWRLTKPLRALSKRLQPR